MTNFSKAILFPQQLCARAQLLIEEAPKIAPSNRMDNPKIKSFFLITTL